MYALHLYQQSKIIGMLEDNGYSFYHAKKVSKAGASPVLYTLQSFVLSPSTEDDDTRRPIEQYEDNISITKSCSRKGVCTIRGGYPLRFYLDNTMKTLTNRNENSLRLEMIAEEKEKLVAIEAALIEEADSVDQKSKLSLMSTDYQPGYTDNPTTSQLNEDHELYIQMENVKKEIVVQQATSEEQAKQQAQDETSTGDDNTPTSDEPSNDTEQQQPANVSTTFVTIG